MVAFVLLHDADDSLCEHRVMCDDEGGELVDLLGGLACGVAQWLLLLRRMTFYRLLLSTYILIDADLWTHAQIETARCKCSCRACPSLVAQRLPV